MKQEKNAVANCKICGTTTLTYKHVMSQKLPIYCSQNCKNKRYEHNCEICNTYFRNAKADTRTCSRKCQTLLRRNKTIDVTCFHCDLHFTRATSDIYTGKRIFCSKKCRDNQHSLDNPSRYGTNWKTARKRRLAFDNYLCTVCGTSENLQVHHLIKLLTFDNPNDANYLENIRTVCESCHKSIEE